MTAALGSFSVRDRLRSGWWTALAERLAFTAGEEASSRAQTGGQGGEVSSRGPRALTQALWLPTMTVLLPHLRGCAAPRSDLHCMAADRRHAGQ